MNPIHAIYYTLTLLLLIGCQSSGKETAKGEYLFRNHDEYHYAALPKTPLTLPSYPWKQNLIGGYPRITKQFFRCNCQTHGLPLREGEEFIYPCLIELLNFIQEKTEKKVLITCGHRCPTHNTAADPTSYNWGSKHQLAAEVDFYLEGMTMEKEHMLKLIKEFYEKSHPEEKAYLTFERYKREGINVSTLPWYNKEIFIKYYLPGEGRDLDNQHSEPYLGIQVRYDRDLKKQVTFDQTQVENYLRD